METLEGQLLLGSLVIVDTRDQLGHLDHRVHLEHQAILE